MIKQKEKQVHQIEDVLEKEGFFVTTTVGTSMYPLLRNRKDTVVICPAVLPLKKYDVPLYKRGNRYILHRIVKVTSTGYVICGDNCLHCEYDITDDQIVGVLSEIVRGDKRIQMDGICYKLYSKVWVKLYPVRFIYKRTKLLLKRGIKKGLKCILK